MSLIQFEAPQGTTVTLKTNMGDISLMFFPEEAPKCVENFVTHCKNGYYNGVTFHRVIQDFMIQGGDPQGTGMGGESIWGYGIADEYSDKLYHFKGALAMAKSSLPNSIGSQFYIVHSDKVNESLLEQMEEMSNIWSEEAVSKYREVGGCPHLDKKYTVFGQVIEGLDVVDKIANVKVDYNDKPLYDIVIESVKVFEK